MSDMYDTDAIYLDFDLSNRDVWTPFRDTYGSHGHIARTEDYALVVFFDVDVFACNGGNGWSWKAYFAENLPDPEHVVPDRNPEDYGTWFASEEEAARALNEWCVS